MLPEEYVLTVNSVSQSHPTQTSKAEMIADHSQRQGALNKMHILWSPRLCVLSRRIQSNVDLD